MSGFPKGNQQLLGEKKVKSYQPDMSGFPKGALTDVINLLEKVTNPTCQDSLKGKNNEEDTAAKGYQPDMSGFPKGKSTRW